jgi:hypothetical protein
MNLFTVSTLAGYKSHYAQDGQLRTLCGREVSNSTDGHDMCKACAKAAAKLTEARERLEYTTRAAETQDDVMQAAPRDAEGTTYVEGCEVESVSRRNGRPLETGMVMRIEDGRPVVSFYGEGDELSDVRPDLFKITSMPVDPTYTPGEPVSVYATVKGETDEFEAAHIPNGNPADVDRWITWAQDNPNWTGVRAANYTPDFPASAEMAARHTDPEQSDNVYERPSAIAAQKRLSDAMPMFNAMIGTVRVDLRGLNYRVDKVKIKTASRHNRATVSVSGRVIVDTPQHDGPNAPTYYGAYAAELFYDVPAEPTVDYATDPYAAMDAEREQLAQDNEVGAQYDGEQDATPTLTLDMSAGRTVLVRLGDHTMTIKNGSDVRLRAAFWARGLGYRPERGRALKWHRSGKTATAPLALV